MKDPKTVPIIISVEYGNVKCDPDPAEAEYEDMVKWISDYEFQVDFRDKTPFKEHKFKAKKEEAKEGKGEKVTTTEAKEKKEKIRFKYSVEVIDDEGKTLTADPDLEIMP